MTRTFLFAATRSDISPVLVSLESSSKIQYAKVEGGSRKTERSVFSSTEISELGFSDAEQTIACSSYLICPSTVDLGYVSLPGRGKIFGRKSVHIPSCLNTPDSISLRAGGLFGDDVCITGELSTVHDTQIAQALMKCFVFQAKKSFERVGAFWLVREVMSMLNSGQRVTQAIQSPSEFDVSR
jgi:hypothetical protein